MRKLKIGFMLLLSLGCYAAEKMDENEDFMISKFNSVPEDVLDIICQFCPQQNLLSLRLTDKKLHNLSTAELNRIRFTQLILDRETTIKDVMWGVDGYKMIVSDLTECTYVHNFVRIPLTNWLENIFPEDISSAWLTRDGNSFMGIGKKDQNQQIFYIEDMEDIAPAITIIPVHANKQITGFDSLQEKLYGVKREDDGQISLFSWHPQEGFKNLKNSYMRRDVLDLDGADITASMAVKGDKIGLNIYRNGESTTFFWSPDIGFKKISLTGKKIFASYLTDISEEGTIATGFGIQENRQYGTFFNYNIESKVTKYLPSEEISLEDKIYYQRNLINRHKNIIAAQEQDFIWCKNQDSYELVNLKDLLKDGEEFRKQRNQKLSIHSLSPSGKNIIVRTSLIEKMKGFNTTIITPTGWALIQLPLNYILSIQK